MTTPARRLPSIDFAARSTPLQQADRLAVALGLAEGQLWIKRDDLTGLVGGGNKARKLELLVAAALAEGADTLVTSGAAQSNHVRATAAAAKAANLACVAVLAEDVPPTTREGNLVLDALLGTDIVWTTRSARHRVFDDTVEQLRSSGRQPYAIPLGGSSPLGASAYAISAEEIVDVLGSGVTIACAVGSGGTMAGLVNGLGSTDHVLGFDVRASQTMAEDIRPLIDQTASLLERPVTARWNLLPAVGDLGYGVANSAVFSAIQTVIDATGLILDPVYSGRAMAGLQAHLAAGPAIEGPVIFVHTGGLPAIFTTRYADQF